MLLHLFLNINIIQIRKLIKIIGFSNIIVNMIYFLVFLILLLCFNMYCFFARKYGIVAHVNERSSHQKPVVTGAGIVFCIGYILYIGYLFWHKKSIS